MKKFEPQRSTKGTKTKRSFLVVLCLLCFFVALLIPTLGQSPFDNFRQRRDLRDESLSGCFSLFLFFLIIHLRQQQFRLGHDYVVHRSCASVRYPFHHRRYD